MKKAKGPYMQKAGRGPMMKTGRGIPMELTGPMYPDPTDPPGKNRVTIGTADAEGNKYNISVGENSGFHQVAKKFNNFIPNSFRNIDGLNEKNDPFNADNTPERRQQLMDSIHKAEINTTFKNSTPATTQEAKKALNNILQQRSTQQRSTQPGNGQTSVVSNLVKNFARRNK